MLYKSGVIYIIRNKTTQKVYIGQTRNFIQRIKDHFKRTHKECSRLYNAILKYGKFDFEFNIIFEKNNISDDELNDLEIFFIKQYKSIDEKYGYNIRKGGKIQSGWNHTDSTKNKISNSKKGQRKGVKIPENSIRFSGGGNPRAKKVKCINTGEVFDCAKNAAKYCNGDNSVIIKCCKGKLKSHRGLNWEYYLN